MSLSKTCNVKNMHMNSHKKRRLRINRGQVCPCEMYAWQSHFYFDGKFARDRSVLPNVSYDPFQPPVTWSTGLQRLLL